MFLAYKAIILLDVCKPQYIEEINEKAKIHSNNFEILLFHHHFKALYNYMYLILIKQL